MRTRNLFTHSRAVVILTCHQGFEPLALTLRSLFLGPPPKGVPPPLEAAPPGGPPPLTRQHHLHQVALLDVSNGAHQLQEVGRRGVMFEEEDLVVKTVEATLGELRGGRERW